MIILGIDPGYAIVGCGVIEYVNNHFRVIEYSAITTPAGMPFNRRLEVIYDGIDEMIKRTHPDALSIEKLFFNSNQKTVIDVGQARGVIMLAAQKNNLPAFEYKVFKLVPHCCFRRDVNCVFLCSSLNVSSKKFL